jgi:hypothetical protein
MAAANPAKDLEKNMRGMLSSAFARVDLVTREEYDVQVAIVPGTVGMRQQTPGDVHVIAGQTTQITIQLDTGIR